MRVAVLHGPGHLTVEERPAPQAGPGQVVVRTASVGVCGSDTHDYDHGRIGRFVVRQPLAVGHEASGEVVEVGEGVTGSRPGSRVSVEPGVPDLVCEQPAPHGLMRPPPYPERQARVVAELDDSSTAAWWLYCQAR